MDNEKNDVNFKDVIKEIAGSSHYHPKPKKKPFQEYGVIKSMKIAPQQKHLSQNAIDSYKARERNAGIIFERVPMSKVEEYAENIENIIAFGPKFCYKMNLLNSEGYRPGFTKQTLEKRVMKNRQKEKNRRRANRRNR